MLLTSAVLFFCLFSLSSARTVPDYIHICHRNDPHVSKCVRESIDVLRPKLKAGIPELGVPALEPLRINEITIFPGGGANNFKAFLRNVDVHGASNFKITKLKIDSPKLSYRVGVKYDSLLFDGDYEIDARLLVVPIKGNGKFNANITDVEGQGVLKCELITNKNGNRELKFRDLDWALKFSDYTIHLDNLFGGDKVLSQAANEVLHENKPEFIKAALPFIQRKTAEILLEAANAITDGLDYDKVFPEK